MTTEEVRAIRISAGMTTAEFAAACQVSQRTVQRWESGARMIGVKMAWWIMECVEMAKKNGLT